MRDVIWKFPLVVTDAQTIAVPSNATILTVAMQHNVPCAWVLIPDTDAPLVGATILMFGTGRTGVRGRYISTIVEIGARLGIDFAWHVFEG